MAEIDRRLLGWAVLCTLCGLRPKSEAVRLKWSEIDLEAKTINVLGTKRGAKPRVIELQPNAVAWLQLVKKQAPDKPGVFFRKSSLAIRKTAEIPWGNDIQRHSFISYMLGLGMPIHKVAEQAGNSARIIYRFYRHPRIPKDVKAFWAINPSAKAQC